MLGSLRTGTVWTSEPFGRLFDFAPMAFTAMKMSEFSTHMVRPNGISLQLKMNLGRSQIPKLGMQNTTYFVGLADQLLPGSSERMSYRTRGSTIKYRDVEFDVLYILAHIEQMATNCTCPLASTERL